MPQAAARGDRASAPPPGGGPRFALRFEEGRGLLALARPLRFALGTVEALELSLGALRFPLDLSAGATRFRTRRTRVRAARVRIDLDAWIASAALAPYRLVPLAPRSGGLAWALGDPYGTVALDAHARVEGPDLLVAISSARSATEGPAPPAARVHAAARAMDLELDAEAGVLRVPRVLSAVLMEALVPHGWRVPDDRGVRVALEILGRRRVLLRALAEGEAEPAHDPAPFERARRLAPVVAALARGDRAEAAREWAALGERLGAIPEELAREAEGVAEAAAEPGDDPLALSRALRRALRDGEPAEALATSLAGVEPCDALAVEALCAAADAALSERPEAAAALLERAAARRPRDGRVALRLLGALAASGRLEALSRAADAALASREPGPERGELAREAAMVCEMAAAPAEAARLWRLAADHLPHDPRVLEGLARAAVRAGREAEARGLWDRAFDARTGEGDAEDAARALEESARLAERAGELDVAEERLARAAGLVPREPELWAALARVRRAAGAALSAARAEDRLLEAAEGAAGSREIADALAAAAEAALAQGERARAQVFAAALAREASDHPALEALRGLLAPEPPPLASGERVVGSGPLSERPPAPPPPSPERSALVPAGPLSERPSPMQARADAGPLERARAAAAARDTAGLRAALSAAERSGDLEAARAIVELALEAVGDGPARRALLAARDRLARA